MAEDAVKVAPEIYKVVLENDQVRVLEGTMVPGAKTDVHGHPALVNIMLEAAKVRFSESGDETTEIELPAGQPMSCPRPSTQQKTLAMGNCTATWSSSSGSTDSSANMQTGAEKDGIPSRQPHSRQRA